MLLSHAEKLLKCVNLAFSGKEFQNLSVAPEKALSPIHHDSSLADVWERVFPSDLRAWASYCEKRQSLRNLCQFFNGNCGVVSPALLATHF